MEMIEKEPFSLKKVILENGTEIFYKKVKGKENQIRILLKAGGARYDPLGKEGCAHLLEHLIFKKTKNFPNEFLMQRYALDNFLEFGASTSLESLVLGGGSIDNIEHLLFILREFLVYHKLEEEFLEKEKIVIAREMGNYQKIRALAHIKLEVKKALFHNHTFGRIINPAGTLWALNSLRIEDLEQHRRKFFIAPNLSIIILTPLPLKEITEKVSHHLSLPKGEKITYPKPLNDFPKPSKNFISYSFSEVTKTKKMKEMGDRLELLAVVPKSGISPGWNVIRRSLKEMLLSELRYRLFWSYDISVMGFNYRDIYVLDIKTSVPANKGTEAKELIFEKILNFKREEKIFDYFKKRRIYELENPIIFPSKIAEEACVDIAVYDRVFTLKEAREKTENFGFREATKLVEKWLTPSRFLVYILTP